MATASDHGDAVSTFYGKDAVDEAERVCDRLKAAVKQCCLRLRNRTDLDRANDVAFTHDPQAVDDLELALSRLGQVSGVKEEISNFCFHPNVGRQVELKNGQRTASKVLPDVSGGIVMSCQPMATHMLYQVSLDEVEEAYEGTVVGVVSCKPESFCHPKMSCTFSPYLTTVLCVGPRGVLNFGKVEKGEWPGLENLARGSKVGLGLRGDTTLHLYVNGKDNGVVSASITRPCFFMMELYSRCLQVSMLPVTPLP